MGKPLRNEDMRYKVVHEYIQNGCVFYSLDNFIHILKCFQDRFDPPYKIETDWDEIDITGYEAKNEMELKRDQEEKKQMELNKKEREIKELRYLLGKYAKESMYGQFTIKENV